MEVSQVVNIAFIIEKLLKWTKGFPDSSVCLTSDF